MRPFPRQLPAPSLNPSGTSVALSLWRRLDVEDASRRGGRQRQRGAGISNRRMKRRRSSPGEEARLQKNLSRDDVCVRRHMASCSIGSYAQSLTARHSQGARSDAHACGRHSSHCVHIRRKTSLLSDMFFPNASAADPSDTTPYRYPPAVAETESLSTGEEIEAAIKRCKPASTPGPDGIPNRILKLLIKSILPTLVLLFRACTEQGYHQLCFREAHTEEG